MNIYTYFFMLIHNPHAYITHVVVQHNTICALWNALHTECTYFLHCSVLLFVNMHQGNALCSSKAARSNEVVVG